MSMNLGMLAHTQAHDSYAENAKSLQEDVKKTLFTMLMEMSYVRNAMQITWTNCAEKLPSNTDKVIVSYKDGYPRLVIGSALCQWVRRGEVYFKWTEFTKEKWEELNKCTGYQ